MPQSVMCHDFAFGSLDFSVQVAMTTLAAAVSSTTIAAYWPVRSALEWTRAAVYRNLNSLRPGEP